MSSSNSQLRVCACVPVYQNPATVAAVLAKCLEQPGLERVITVDDGSFPPVRQLLPAPLLDSGRLVIERHETNLGKGAALITGFEAARKLGCSHVLTLDGDGQHFPEDAVLLLEAGRAEPGALVIGARRMGAGNSPWLSRFGRGVSDRAVQWLCGFRPDDSQSGFRLYPLAPMAGLEFWARRFDFEMEVLLKLGLAGVPVRSVAVGVVYAGKSRVTHFRLLRDNFRIARLYARVLMGRVLGRNR